MGRGLREAHLIEARLKVERNGLAHDCEILVINRERKLAASPFLRLARKARNLRGRECNHCKAGKTNPCEYTSASHLNPSRVTSNKCRYIDAGLSSRVPILKNDGAGKTCRVKKSQLAPVRS